MRRRGFIGSLASGALAPWLTLSGRHAEAATLAFDHGVASGDPLADRVIIWTRLSGLRGQSQLVRWRVAADPEMRTVLNEGSVTTYAARDYTVKVDAGNLPSGAELYYQFYAAGVASPVGRTKTLPLGATDAAKFAVVSCSNHPAGYFHAYREIANRSDLDAVIHLGDYIYEYAMGEYATEHAEALDRVPDPIGEIQTLDDYRRRHAQYKSDADSIAMHAVHPLIAVWDDHELSNDAWLGGAQNHQSGEGSWPQRRDAAIQAWLEWMPVRVAHDRGDTRIFRRFVWGDLASLVMLDTRMHGRDLQAHAGDAVTPESVQAALRDPSRRMLGDLQESWLRRTLAGAGETVWQLIGQQVMMSPLRSPDLEPILDPNKKALIPPEALKDTIVQSKANPPLLLDTWNGYPFARQDLLNVLEQHCKNPVVLSGDMHTSMAGNIVPDGRERPVAVELMTGSVTSPGFSEYLPEKRPGLLKRAMLETNASLTYIETLRRGWLYLDVSREVCLGEWHLIDNILSREYEVDVDIRLAVYAGKVAEGLQVAE